MMRTISLFLLAAALAAPVWATAASDPLAPDPLQAAIASPDRSAASVARDGARHPLEVLSFLGVRPGGVVVEIWPGGGYWTEILAPYLHGQGKYDLALGDEQGTPVEQAYAALPKSVALKFAADPARYGDIRLTRFASTHPDMAPPDSVDTVLTFRNLHNWMNDGDAPQLLAAIHRALKPGGVFGVEDHRARPDQPQDPKADDGYVRQDYATALIEKAGFKLVATSEIERNSRDTTHWPQGVWTLPPTYRGTQEGAEQSAADHARYEAIGEADNFLLKFEKIG